MKTKRRHRPKRKGVLKTVLGSLTLILAGLMIAASVLMRADEWHKLDESLILDCPQALKICDSSGNIVSVRGKQKRIWVKLGDIPKHTAEAFVAAEDARFYSHSGVDVYRIFGAAWADIRAGGYVQGASTISQQLIKLSHLSTEKTLGRKIEEASLAVDLENRFSKDEIMEMYLNFVYFGGGFYGIETAALGYFGVHASELSPAQSAQLAGILKSPSAYAPHIDPEASKERRDTVLSLMHDRGYLTDDEYSAALCEEASLSPALPQMQNELIGFAVSEAAELTGLTPEELYSGGYTIKTTLDTRIQSECEMLMADDSSFPDENSQGALVVIGKNGRIEAMVGQRGAYEPAGVNRAVNALRQPGSLIKPIIVYAPAMEKGVCDPATVILDEPTDFSGYEPRNSDDKYYGCVTLREAISKSLNVPAVKLFDEIGVEEGMRFASRMGIDMSGESAGLPLALGGFTYGVSPLMMAGAYSVFENGGVFIRPYSVLSVEDRNGNTLFSRSISGERVISEANSFMLTSMLQSAASEGTGRRLGETGLPLAAKTGTSIDSGGVRDAWCAAYTPEYTAVVWMGTDSADEGSLPETAVGGNQPALLLKRLFSFIYEGSACPDFTVPEGVKEELIDGSGIEDGKLYSASDGAQNENTVSEYRPEKAESLPESPEAVRAEAPDRLGWRFGADGKPVIEFAARTGLHYSIVRSENSADETVLCETAGGETFVSFRDESVRPGAMYTYRVIAKNPLRPDEFAESRRMIVIVPYAKGD